MSIVISSMPAAGLIEMPPVSKTTPLPTSAKGAASPPPFHCMTTTLDGLSDPCPDREQRAHPERFELGLLQHLDLDPEIAQADQPVGELGGGQHVGGLADQVAGEEHPLRLRRERREGRLGGGRVADLEAHRPVRRRRIGLGRAIVGEVVGAQREPERHLGDPRLPAGEHRQRRRWR